MKSQYQNFQKHLNGNYSNQEAIVIQTQAVPLTEEVLNQDYRICYKKRREELKASSSKRNKQQMPKIKTQNSSKNIDGK